MAAYAGKSIRITTNDGIYRGVVHSLDVSCSKITLTKVECCANGEEKQLKGLHHFYGPEMEHLEILEEQLEEKMDKNNTEDGGPPLVTKKENPKHLQQLRDYSSGTDRAGGGGYVSDGIVDIMKSNLRRRDNRRRQNSGRWKKSVRFCHDIDDPPGTGRNYTMVDTHGDLYNQAVDHIRQQSIIGLALQGINIGRKGKICWVQVATRNSIFLFDVLTLGALCFDAGLGQVIQDENILKVMHDCRNPSDALWHQYGLHVVNVFDTQVADVMVSRMNHQGGEFPRYVSGLTACLMEHLTLNPEELHFHRVRLDHKDEDQAIWAERPLPDHLLDAAAKDVMYLRDLRVALMDKLMSEFVMGVDVYLSVRRDSSDKDALKMDTMGHLLPGRFQEVVEQAARKRRQHVEPLDQNGFRENCDGVVSGNTNWSRDVGHGGERLAKGVGDNTPKEPVPAVKEGSIPHVSELKAKVHVADQPSTDTTPKSATSSRAHPEDDGTHGWQQGQTTSPRDTLTLTPAGLETARHLNKLPKKLLMAERQDAKVAEDPVGTSEHLTESSEDMPELWAIPPSKSSTKKEKCWMPLTVELPADSERSSQLNDGTKSDGSLKNPYASSKGKLYNMKGDEVGSSQGATQQPFFYMPKVGGLSTEAAKTDAEEGASSTASPQQAMKKFSDFSLSESSQQDPRAHPLKASGGRLVKNPNYLHGWDRATVIENKGKPSGPDVVQYSSHSSDDDLPRSSSSNSQPSSSHSSSATSSPTKNSANGDAHKMRGVQSSSPSFSIGRGALRLNALKSLANSSTQDKKFIVPKSGGTQQRDKNNGSVKPTSKACPEAAQAANMVGIGPPSTTNQDVWKPGIGRASVLTLRSDMYSELALPEELQKDQQNSLRSNVSKYPFPSDCEVRSIPKPQRGFLRNW